MTLLRRMLLDVTFIFAEKTSPLLGSERPVGSGLLWRGGMVLWEGGRVPREKQERPCSHCLREGWSRLRMGGVLMKRISLLALIWE